MSKTKVRALFIPLAVLVVGCASPIDPATSQCASPPSSKDEQGPAAVLAVANGHHIIDGTWLNGRTASVATIDLSVGDKLADSTTGCGGTLRLDATATVKTRDGLIDARGTVLKFDQPYVAHLDVPLPDLSEAFAHPDASLGSLPAAWPLQRFTAPTLVLTITADGLRADVVVDEERVVGRWTTDVFQIPARAAPTYSVPPELVTPCAPAADYAARSVHYTPFASASDALAAMPGTWIRCRAYGGSAHDGIHISTDGTWRYLTWQNGAFITSPGLRREGTLEEPIDTHSLGFNGPGYYQVNLRGPGVWHPTSRFADLLIMGDDTAPPDFGVSVYVHSDRVVTEAPNPYAAGERGGQDACAVRETGTIDPDLGAALGSTLSGEWTTCTGESLEGYTRLRFDGQSGVTLLDENGNQLASRTFRALHPETMPVLSPRSTILLFEKEEDWEDWDIMFSQRPLKLWANVTSPHGMPREMIFSPLP